MKKQFQLIETMRVSEPGQLFLVERHLKRLSRSAQFFSFECDIRRIRDEILQAVPHVPRPVCLRLTLSKEGVSRLESGPLPSGYAQPLKLSKVRVDSNDVFLYHKTTNRGMYDQARRECDDGTDAILVNERGEITETTIANIAVFRESRWVTPPVSCGLLAGVMREELLALGEIAEGVIPANQLEDGELIRCFNALRGVNDVLFRPAR